jgi:nucleoside-diphosphate-sugar epimerase
VRVLVTGASGFLGHAVCAGLRARDHDVSALVRRPGSEPAGTEPIAGDLGDGGALAAIVATARPDSVIHLAAEIATQRDPKRIEEVNVAGTQRLLDACREFGSPRFLFVSTVVTGDAGGAALDEDSVLPVQTAYGASKQAGERLVRDSGLPSVIIRPSHVYGPGGWYAEEIVKRLRQPGRMVVIGSGQNWWDVVHVDDVAAACVQAAERAEPGSLFHVVDDEPISEFDFIALTARALGVGKPRRVPAWLAARIGGADPIAAVARSAKSANGRIKRELGWAPAFPTAHAGVPDAIARIHG